MAGCVVKKGGRDGCEENGGAVVAKRHRFADSPSWTNRLLEGCSGIEGVQDKSSRLKGRDQEFFHVTIVSALLPGILKQPRPLLCPRSMDLSFRFPRKCRQVVWL